MRLPGSALLLLISIGCVAARAEDLSGCAKFKWPVERERAAFAAPGLPGVASGETLPGIAAAATVTLRSQSAVAFVHPPGRKPKADPAYAAVLTMPPLAAPGPYQVTLSGEAWIDVLQDGKEIRSSGFSGQPDCVGVRKSVKFALQPGPATIQISGASSQTVNIEVLPAE